MNRWTSWSRILLLVPLAVMFGTAVCSDQTFPFRDSGHFYYPLFHWIDTEWRAGRVPLWNPLENTGLPILADTSSSIFYPGKLVFFLPVDFGLRYKLYIVGHVLLALGATYWLARRWRARVGGATLAAVAYTFGGNVVFQHSNVVFLVGAAWLPLALFASERMLVERSVTWALRFGMVLALMVLGGDPQAGYNAGIAATCYALLLWWRERKLSRYQVKSEASKVVRHYLVLLGVAAITGLALAAIQIIPSWNWASQSSRAAETMPIDIYSAVNGSWSEARSGIFGSPEEGTHHRHIYEFSVGPWRMLEFVWPNFTGRMFPTHHRWIEILPAEDRVWSPSNYLGLLPFLCGIAALRLRRGPVRQRWLTWLTLAATIGSLGWYGFGWLIDEVQFWFTQNPAKSFGLGKPVGGLYWLMVTFLPGYSYFRFPAKLLVVAVLGMSLLAAHGFDALLLNRSRTMSRVLWILGAVSVLAAITTVIVWPTWKLWDVQQSQANTFHSSTLWYGPLDARGATLDLLTAFMHTGLLCFVLRWLFAHANLANRQRIALGLLTITVVEICLANSWLIPLAPEAIVRTPSKLYPLMTADRQAMNGSSETPFAISNEPSAKTISPQIRVYGSIHLGTPRRFELESSRNRLAESLSWEHDTLFPKHHLLCSVGAVETHSTLESHDYKTYVSVCRNFFWDAEGRLEHEEVASRLGARYLVLPAGVMLPNTSPITIPDDERLMGDVYLCRNNSPLPRVWIVRDITPLPMIRNGRVAEISRRTDEVLFPDGKPRDMRTNAVVETDNPVISVPPSPESHGLVTDIKELCEIISDKSQRVEIVAQLSSPGLLVLNDLYFPEWRAFVRDDEERISREIPILRTNRIMRGVMLPAGKHHVVFEYRPTTFYSGAAISGLAWLVVTCFLAIGSRTKPLQ